MSSIKENCCCLQCKLLVDLIMISQVQLDKREGALQRKNLGIFLHMDGHYLKPEVKMNIEKFTKRCYISLHLHIGSEY